MNLPKLAALAVALSLAALAATPAHAEYPGTMVSGTGLCLDVARSEMGKKGGRVLAWECHGGDNQKWTIQGKRGEIRSSTGMCLDASRSNMHENGARVMIWKCHGGPNQQWVFAGQGLRNGSGLCLDISRKSLRDSGGRNGKVQLWKCHFEDNQQWDFQEAAAAAPPPPSIGGLPLPIPLPGIGQPPSGGQKGNLPNKAQVPPTRPTALDGLWKLDANDIPYKIEASRVYAMAQYMHLFIFPVNAHDVVVRDVAQTGPGQLSGRDLALLGPWSARLQADGTLAISVQGALGPFTSTMRPIQLSDPAWFAQEMAAVGGGGFPAPIPPGYGQPPAPQPGYGQPPAPGTGQPPAPGGSPVYPPGWGD